MKYFLFIFFLFPVERNMYIGTIFHMKSSKL